MVESPDEIVIFPFSDIERHGIEDLRMVRFTEDDGSHIIYGTFTAFNGERVFPQLMEFRGERTIEVSLITGECARNKGMALFPRRIRGNYAMISRIDNEKTSTAWNQTTSCSGMTLARSRYRSFPWQIMLIGNCGSPIETEAGWLLLTHGVGAMRQYCIGAMLLEKDDPSRVIGQTREPLIMPTDHEHRGLRSQRRLFLRAMVHNRMLIVPYAVSDLSSTMARIDLDSLLRPARAMKQLGSPLKRFLEYRSTGCPFCPPPGPHPSAAGSTRPAGRTRGGDRARAPVRAS